MNWVDEIRRIPINRLRVFSKAGAVVASNAQSETHVYGNLSARHGYVGSSSDTFNSLFVKEDDGKEFTVEKARVMARVGHRVAVFYLGSIDSRNGYDVAYYNYDTDSMSYDPAIRTHDTATLGVYTFLIALFLFVPAAIIVFPTIMWVAGKFVVLQDLVLMQMVMLGLIISISLAVWGALLLKKNDSGQKRVDTIKSLVEAEKNRVKMIWDSAPSPAAPAAVQVAE